MENLRVEISWYEIPRWATVGGNEAYQHYICTRLRDAGVPCLGGPVSLRVDFSKGKLVTWNDDISGKMIFVWKFA